VHDNFHRWEIITAIHPGFHVTSRFEERGRIVNADDFVITPRRVVGNTAWRILMGKILVVPAEYLGCTNNDWARRAVPSRGGAG
jgi:hypothetical protein